MECFLGVLWWTTIFAWFLTLSAQECDFLSKNTILNKYSCVPLVLLLWTTKLNSLLYLLKITAESAKSPKCIFEPFLFLFFTFWTLWLQKKNLLWSLFYNYAILIRNIIAALYFWTKADETLLPMYINLEPSPPWSTLIIAPWRHQNRLWGHNILSDILYNTQIKGPTSSNEIG